MRLFPTTHRIGSPRARETSLLAEASLGITTEPVAKTASSTKISDTEVQKIALQMGLGQLRRVAGNIFERPASKDFWKVGTDGSLKRMVSSEVDLDESLSPLSTDDPESHIASILADLEY